MRGRYELLLAELRTIWAGQRAADRLQIARALLSLHARFGLGRHMLGWLPAIANEPAEIAMRSGLRLLLRPSDVISLVEQVGLDIYAIDVPGPEPAEIVDLGAHVGLATIALAKRHPEAQFICVEPAEDTRQLLRENLARNAIKAEVFSVAVVGQPGRVALHLGSHPGGSWVEPSGDGEIEGVSLRGLLDRAGLDHVGLLKMDIEGWEKELFENAGEWAPHVDTVICELHDELSPDRVQELLADYGFTLRSVSPRAVCLSRHQG